MCARQISYLSVSLFVLGTVGCDKLLKRGTDADAGATAKNASSSAAGSASAEPPVPQVVPVCKVEAQKAWTKGVNAITGLTAVTLQDGSKVVGLAVGNTPHLLSVAPSANGKLTKVTVAANSAFAKAPKPAEGTRTVWRVTPIKPTGTNKVRALVDFRDEVKMKAPEGKPEVSKSRRVVCGPVDGADDFVRFEGPAIIDEPKHQKDPITALKGFGLLTPKAPYREVRDCRSFYDPKTDDEWVVGSEITIEATEPKPRAMSALFIESGARGARQAVVTETVATDPWKKVDFELPISHELGSAAFLVAARTPGSLVALLVGRADKKPMGAPVRYPGIYQMPDVSNDGPDDVFMAAQTTGKEAQALRAMRLSGQNPSLPKALSNVQTDDDDSKTEGRPEFLRDVKGQRWVAYIEDAKAGKGRLEIIPVTAAFRAAGKPYQVTKDEEKALEARMFAKSDGGFVVVYIRDTADGGAELVSEDLSCTVRQ